MEEKNEINGAAETPEETTAPAGAETDSAPETKSKSEKPSKKAKGEIDALKAALADEMKKSAECAKKLEECESRYLHMLAEYDNFRRRSAKEREGVYADALADVISEVLPLIDNLERASLYSDAEKVAEGLGMTAKSAGAMLEKLGVSAFGQAGDSFDPQLHNAVMHVEDETHGENEVVEVFQKGYAKGDRVIRYAMVKVAN